MREEKELMSKQTTSEESQSQSILKAAQHLMIFGYRPIPTVRNEKRPAIPWKKFQKEKPTVELWDGWINQFPGCGIGIVTTGLVIIDIDLHRDYAGHRTVHNVFVDQPIIKSLMEKSPVVRTRSGGTQIYFRQKKGREIKNSASLLAKDVDIRAEGGFAVVPPTKLGELQYQWIGHILTDRPENLPTVPDKILDRISSGTKKKTSAKTFEDMNKSLDEEDLVTGSRNQTLHRLASKARGRGIAGMELQAIMKMHNRKCVDDNGNPDPLPGSELKVIYDSVMGYPTNDQKSEIKKEVSATGEEILTIQTNGRRVDDLIGECWTAAKRGEIYLSGGSLSYIQPAGNHTKIQRFTKFGLWGYLASLAEWVTENQKGMANSQPPLPVCQAMIDRPENSVPEIESVASAPFYTSEGEMIQDEGYHIRSKTYLSLGSDLSGLSIPDNPTGQQSLNAFTLIADDLLGDFPFAEVSDMAHAVAALLSPFMRDMITGPMPIHMIEASSPGSGKTLLAGLISRIVTGRTPAMMTMPRSADEQQKVITTILVNNPQVTVIDNVASGVWSSQFASALTAESWEGRILGKTESCSVPVKTLWIFSGNNPQMSEEIARRCVRIRLEPTTAKPYLRTGFTHRDINQWVKDNRRELVTAILTLIQFWIKKDKPEGDYVFGSFQSWADQIGGILDSMGLNGFLDNQDEFTEQADTESADWEALVDAWHRKFGPQEVSVTQLFDLAEFDELVPFAMDGNNPRSQKTKFGIQLARLRGRIFNGLKVTVKTRKGSAPNRYYLTK